ncbi:MAG: gamma-glutamyl-gamma-aminobutyrate hydrolase family protein [Bacteroidales bacterium]|nr:gamma-glutamyl-gamma-aminobutyrate hydrolase family protein [Bacteroidales bacterium]
MGRRILLTIVILLSAAYVTEARRKPLIGITTGCSPAEYSKVRRTYGDAVIRSGGIPLLLPQVNGIEEALEVVSRLDGILFTGGEDVDPARYGQTVLNETVDINHHRDTLDFLYAEAAIRKGIPILAICRGAQLMNVALGGSLFQDLPTEKPGNVAHRQSKPGETPTHLCIVYRNTLLHRIMEKDTLQVNSFHHQAVSVPSDKVTVSARCDDGVVEAFEIVSKKQWLLAVQFHPELLVRADDRWLALFKAFIKAAR